MKIGKYYIELFDTSPFEDVGHSRWIGKILPLDYIMLSIEKPMGRFLYRLDDWYDSPHHLIQILWFALSWGGYPYSNL